MPSLFAIFEDSQQTIQVSESQLQSHKKIKKKLLKAFGYYPSDYDKIRLNIMQIYIYQPQNLRTPIFNDQTYEYILSFLVQNHRPIKLYVEALQELKKKEKKKMEVDEMQFDENGSQISNEELAILAPSKPTKYREQKLVRCAFCKKSNKDKNSLVNCGGIYGPFSSNKYSHLLCAIWCNKVYLNEEGQLIGVSEQMKEGSKYSCIYCHKKGAALCCHGEKCQKTIHFECGKKGERCFFNWQKYQFWCHVCKKNLGIDFGEKADMDIEESFVIKLE